MGNNFDNMTPDPRRKMYGITLDVMSKTGKAAKWLSDAIDFVKEFSTYNPLIAYPMILFPFDGSIKWVMESLMERKIPAIVIEIKPETFYCTNASLWLYVYEFHKANGHIYPAEADANAEANKNQMRRKDGDEQ